jgi:hypothetical protein
MKDLKTALELEKDYKKLRLNKKLKDSFNFNNKLKNLGFKDIQDFVDEKKLVYLKNIKIKEVFNNDEGINQLLNSRDTGEEILYILLPCEKTKIYVGDLPFNKKYCDDNMLDYYYMGHTGDSIVCTETDLSLNLSSYNEQSFHYLHKLLYKYLLNITKSDKLVCPVFGRTSSNYGDLYYSWFHFSFDLNLDLIDIICNLKYNNLKGLNYYNSILTKEKLINDIKTWQL